ncbi:HvfC/BufC N-terminal domain-containing protein [Methylomicrobium sp. RS1]|jgi:hypothetical protein|uniref:HvfC/BufC N-terminal domain-containing protein n=1 Tax=Candidatus Methylomicrobium oryzae TaxID=2802053 RepID=UPI0019247388|nr:putative DNA-binding domain-containing protein [Methylomicrobium sp. RS1]MBL1264088.1 putative DNA-binding domain-containing protein [Methylomicrobium sp. RS1]
MNGLHELQRDFSAFVWAGKTGLGERIVPNGFEPEQRLAIYRNNTLIGLTQALRDVYPVIEKLVGERFFHRLGRDYIRRYPPNTGCLQTFGDRFADFLAASGDVCGQPYLPDTARLEWLRHEAYFESDRAGIDAASLADVPPERYGGLRFELHPSVRLLASRYPVRRIWEFHRENPAEDGRLDLDAEGGCRLVIFRLGWEVETAPLDSDGYRFLTGLQAGLTLSEAASGVLPNNPDFDLAALLRFCLSRSLFSEYF